MLRPKRWALPVVLVGSLVLGSSAMAGGFGSTTVLRSTSARLIATDAAADGGKLVIGWQEDQPGNASFMRWSTNAGTSFAPQVRISLSPTREIQVDACDSWAWATTGVHTPSSPAGGWLVELDGRKMGGSFHEHGLVTFSGVAKYPDIACAGDRSLAIVWLQKVGGSWRVKMLTRGAALTLTNDPPERHFDLGVADLGPPAVTATGNRVVVAWFANKHLKVKRFSLGAGSSVPVTPHATQDLGHLPAFAGGPEIGSDGQRVVLAYTNRADLVVRRSTDGGVSFSSQHRLIDESYPGEGGAFAASVDVHGAKVLVEGSDQYASTTFHSEGHGFLSIDGGGSWSQISSMDGGQQVGALYVTLGDTREAEAWDEFVAEPATQHLRFHEGY